MFSHSGNWLLLLSLLVQLGKTTSTYYPYIPGRNILIRFLMSTISFTPFFFFCFTESRSHSEETFRIKSDDVFFFAFFLLLLTLK